MMKPIVLDSPHASGYMNNLRQALQIHSPDSLQGAIDYAHLSGLYLPILPTLKRYNDYVIDIGGRVELDQRDALLHDLTDYLDYRQSLLEGRVLPAHAKRFQFPQHHLSNVDRLQQEMIQGAYVCLMLILNNEIYSLQSEAYLLLDELRDHLAGVSAVPDEATFEQLKQLIGTKQFKEAHSQFAR